MKQFVLREYLVKHNTINLVNGFRNRLEMISSGIPLWASIYVLAQPSVKK